MKNSIKIGAAVALICFGLWECSTPSHQKSGALVPLPNDVLACCTVDTTALNTWFKSGKVSTNGIVTPANSLTFASKNNCEFYKWSERMFLWATSPVSATDSTIQLTGSPQFYTVSPADSAGNRTFIPNTLGKPVNMFSKIAKFGPNRLPVIRDKKGHIFEVEAAKPGSNAKETVKDGSGKVVTVDHVSKDAKGVFTFVDAAGKTIDHPKAIIGNMAKHSRIAHRFKAGNHFVYLDEKGNVVDTEEGQATGDELMSNTHSLVYYMTTVNDVYAWYRTMYKNLLGVNKDFPTTQAEMHAIVKFAKQHNAPLMDSTALALEFKSSWVEASKVTDPQNYITTMATIPTYDTTNASKWIPNGKKTVLMALVGMHVAGSVAGHPEMIWSTFEQQNNSPTSKYQYVNKDGTVKTVEQANLNLGWLFMTNTFRDSMNVSHMTSVNPAGNLVDTITAKSYQGGVQPIISPSNTMLTQPWGTTLDSLSNPEDKTSARSNSEVLSLNVFMQSKLTDKRKNYLMIGATWTGGAPSNGQSYSSTNKTDSVAIGTNNLANSTMETYFQSPTNSCFSCHSSFKVFVYNADTISHVFANIQPLIKMHDLAEKQPKKK